MEGTPATVKESPTQRKHSRHCGKCGKRGHCQRDCFDGAHNLETWDESTSWNLPWSEPAWKLETHDRDTAETATEPSYSFQAHRITLRERPHIHLLSQSAIRQPRCKWHIQRIYNRHRGRYWRKQVCVWTTALPRPPDRIAWTDKGQCCRRIAAETLR